MLSDEMKRYTEAMIRLGERFDPLAWCKEEIERSRKAEMEALGSKKQSNPKDEGQAVSVPIAAALAQQKRPSLSMRSTQEQDAPPKKTAASTKLLAVSRACLAFKESRKRDAIYSYLREVYTLVRRYRLKRRLRKLLRQACAYAELKYDKRADAFAVILRCTSDGALDDKSISCLSRALRYVDKEKSRKQSLKTFMKARGGINGCAARFAARRRQAAAGCKKVL